LQSSPRWIDDYDPALEAHQVGPAALIDYLVTAIQLGDALVTTGGQLLAQHPQPRLQVAHQHRLGAVNRIIWGAQPWFTRHRAAL
jgi:hypothetical protein